MSGNPVGVDNTSRRKFDKEEYLERARQRELQEKDEARKGKGGDPNRTIESADQRALGMSMRVERASLEQVQKRFESLKKRKDPSTFSEQDLDERILKQQQEEEERKRQWKEKKEKKKEQAAQHEPEDIDPDVAAMMGFGGFGSSKK